MTGNARKVYDAYLADFHAKHGEIIQPEVFNFWGGSYPRDFGNAIAVWGGTGKFWSGNCKTYEFADGRVYEASIDSRGNDIVAVWPTWDSYNKYVQPKSFNEYFEFW